MLWLRYDPAAGRADVLFLLFIVWAGDIGAYLVGRWIGGPRLAPLISPGKTWSGAVGGLLAAVAAGLARGPFPVRRRALASSIDRRRAWGRCAGRRSVGKLCQASLAGEGFGPSHPWPRRAVRSPRWRARRGAGCRPAGAHPGTWSSSVAMTSAPRSVTVLGSTGSVGTQTVQLLAGRAGTLPGPRPGRRPQRTAAGRTGHRAERGSRGDRRSRQLRRTAPGAGRHRHRHRGGPRGRRGSCRAAGRLDHGGDHRRRRPCRDPGRDQPRRLRGPGQQGGAGLRRRGHAARGARGRCHAAAGRLRAQRDIPGAGGRQPRGGREDRAHRLGRPVPHRLARRHGSRHAGRGAQASGLVDGRQDQHRFRHPDEQGPRTDRGGAAVLAARSRRSTCWCIRNR